MVKQTIKVTSLTASRNTTTTKELVPVRTGTRKVTNCVSDREQRP